MGVFEEQLEKVPQDQRDAARAACETPEANRTDEQKQLLIDFQLNVTLENVAEIDRQAAQELKRLENQFKTQQQRRGFLQAIQESGGPISTVLFVLSPVVWLHFLGSQRRRGHAPNVAA